MKEQLLNDYTPEDIMNFIFGGILIYNKDGTLDVTKYYKNPFRDDGDAGCNFFYTYNNTLMFKDWAYSKYTGDAFKLLTILYNTPFLEACERCYNDMKKGKLPRIIGTNEGNEQIEKFPTISYQPFPTHLEQNYFSIGHISVKTLLKYNVHACNRVMTQSGALFYWSPDNPLYVYNFGANYIKMYRPLADRKDKWRSTVPKGFAEGYRQLPSRGDVIVITKSLKDVMVLHEIGVPAIAPISENSEIHEFIIADIKQRFDSHFILYDNDKPGILAAKVMSEKTGIDTVIIPKETNTKDCFEYSYKYGLEELKRLLKKLKIL